MLDWTRVDTVLLDMDGTLLDLHFDSHFWLEHLPRRYAEHHGLAPDEARERLIARIMRERGTLNWYCVDYWSEELGVDIASLKREVEDRIAFRPSVPGFLAALGRAGKRRVIVTNAHRKSLEIKLQRTDLAERVDRIICSHDYGLPKEDVAFWGRLRADEPFDPERTALVDDSLAVLRSAARYGIRHLFGIARPDSRAAPVEADEFPLIEDFEHLGPHE